LSKNEKFPEWSFFDPELQKTVPDVSCKHHMLGANGQAQNSLNERQIPIISPSFTAATSKLYVDM